MCTTHSYISGNAVSDTLDMSRNLLLLRLKALSQRHNKLNPSTLCCMLCFVVEITSLQGTNNHIKVNRESYIIENL